MTQSQPVGTISGEVQPMTFKIQLSDKTIGHGTYVKIKHDVHGWVLARIEFMKRYLDDFDEVETIASCRTIGYKEDNNILMPKTPFGPNEKVFLADDKLITDMLGIQSRREGNIYLGFLEGHNIPVYIDVKKTIAKHVSVLAKTGAGKSYTVGVLLEELLKTDIAIVIIDPHGEYGSLRYDNDDYDGMLKYNVQVRNYADKVTEYATNLEINTGARKIILQPKFDMMELSNIMPMRLLDKEKAVLYSALKDLEETGYEDYTIEDLVRKVEEQPTNLKWKVLSGLEALQESGVFEGAPVPLTQLVKKGAASIINLKGTEPHIQHLVVAKIAKDLFDARCVGKIDEVFILVEEAHNFCPERGFGDVISSGILRTIASEGRKFGINLCVVSQRPARVDKNVLSQCNTQIILKVTNPNDLRAIGQSIEGFSAGMENEIKQLSVGHALIVGECVEQPITVDIRVRETKHMGSVAIKKEDDVPEEIKEKAERMKKKHKEMLERKQKGKPGEERREKTFWDMIVGFFIEDWKEAENRAEKEK